MEGFRSKIRSELESIDLTSRPGIGEVVKELASKDVEKSFVGDIRKSLEAVIEVSQRSLQLLACLKSGSNNQQKTYSAFIKSKSLSNWLEAMRIASSEIDNNTCSVFDSLCEGLSKCASDIETRLEIGKFRIGDSNTLQENTWQPWGRGSLVHSLADFAMFFNADPLLDVQLKETFKERARKHREVAKQEVKHNQEAKIEIKKLLERDYAYEIETNIQAMQRKFESKNFRMCHLSDGQDYQGPLNGNKPEGFGCLFSNDEIIYRGEFIEGKFDGYGQFFNGRQMVYMGQFKTGHPNGIGLIFEDKVLRYRGQILNGKRHGIGEERNNTGKVIYRGWHFNNKKHGIGIVYSGTNTTEPNHSGHSQPGINSQAFPQATPDMAGIRNQTDQASKTADKYLDVD